MDTPERESWWQRARPWLLTAGAVAVSVGVVVLVARRFGPDGGQFHVGQALVTVTRPAPEAVTVAYAGEAGSWAGWGDD